MSNSPNARRPATRFAPSPNGLLHLGHAFAAVTAFETARALGARFLLRIEDIDAGRSRPEFEAAILEDLAWLGLEWEEPVRRQSEHFADYRAGLARLEAQGLLYPCFASRTEIGAAVARREAETGTPWPRDPDGAPVYPGLHRALAPAEREAFAAQGRRPALRLRMDEAMCLAGTGLSWLEIDGEGKTRRVSADPSAWGDVVVARKDVPTSYHLAVTLDDALQGVSHVVRGQDLFAATSVHRLLQVLLALPEPVYRHHPLVLDAGGAKLSKSTGAASLKSLREAGRSAGDIRRLAGLTS